jgi:transcriptional regulator with XRE-family HTH domain
MAARPPREPAESKWSGPDDLRKVFGQNARAARVKAGLTQAQLAERTEAGHQNITIDTMAALARVIGRDVSALLPTRIGTEMARRAGIGRHSPGH